MKIVLVNTNAKNVNQFVVAHLQVEWARKSSYHSRFGDIYVRSHLKTVAVEE